jgi:hypothetical protein
MRIYTLLRPLRVSQRNGRNLADRKVQHISRSICTLGVLTPIFEGILAALAIAALAAGLLINASVPLDAPSIPAGMEYEAN